MAEPNLKKELLKDSEISIILDTYDDIFSDFDPRPYSDRTISDDFLIEVKRAAKVKESGQIEIKFLMPANQRNLKKELLIRKRLHEYFGRHHSLIHKEINNLRKKGLGFLVVGIALAFGATYAHGLQESFGRNLITVILEPASWFTMWSGLDKIVHEPRHKEAELNFQHKMQHAEINFVSY